ncbi:ribonuclease D [Litorimonas cladophorae]|uniref:Ribonuclease D n=1 Tax=Litorimonas cladophorae TaxID=1220491 RepID=A0A918KAZ1_9PROT|nr:ribonuclease D [Litorimonas cladophorae]GGX56488.1 ribonuclease D [Litorimonas cladophorae]
MNIIRDTDSLRAFCDTARNQDFVCIDTEFMRESTFFSILCLVQIATSEDEAIVDPLADGIDLTPLKELLMDESVTNVLHAARQDMEIFYRICGAVPGPTFDTQIAGMALGLGDSAGYGALVKDRLDINLDKGARFTDWSRRPLSEKQLSYAMADVTHLRDLYPDVLTELEEKGRLDWVMQEMEQHSQEDLYTFEPEEAWQRLKLRGNKKHYLASLKAAASWRERQAIKKDIPRRRVLKDDAIYDLAQQRPRTIDALAKLRGIPRGFEKSSSAKELVESIGAAIDNADDYAPPAPKTKHMPPSLGPRIEMLKTLLRLRTEVEGIATRLVANARDIEQLAAFGEAADIDALKGWRREIFGQDALDMLRGHIALRLEGEDVVAERLD